MKALARKLIGSSNDRKLKKLQPMVAKINDLEPSFKPLSDEALAAKTAEFKERHQKGESLDALLPEAFAAVREAAVRALGQRHFDVQLMGGMVLHHGDISEMRTGEGKTLVATLPAYLNALAGQGVHVVTVNDYLAERDSQWMGRVFAKLGMTTGVIVPGLNEEQRRAAYAADITYGTNNELGFDYLRDNMKYRLADMVQRGHYFAIVDEVDSILIDEARTPLIISGPTDDKSELYKTIDKVIPMLFEVDYEVDEKFRSATFTEDGMEKLERLLSEQEMLQGSTLYDPVNVAIVHHCNQALRAHMLFQKDRDYIVKDGEVILIDEFTGRMMKGRRLSEGLHQAIEAKEGVEIHPENQTLASITFQNYFRLYKKLAGMTGTAITEASEFADIYKLDVMEIPTNRPVQRIDVDDEVYRTAPEKYKAIIEDIRETHKISQPVLVGTVSIEKSELLSDMLRKENIPHQVLNARYHEQEAHIIAQAGVPGAVTIATNMAGRGTDIQLGGNVDMRLSDWLDEQRSQGREPDQGAITAKRAEIEADVAAKKQKALDAGGLYVLGTERHESRRIDNQLRGRTGRQGDPGKSKFYVCLEDDLMRIFAADRLDGLMRRFGIKEGEAIVHPFMNKALETSQRRVEQRNFEQRKNILKYDDVINNQRKAIFEQRIEFMESQHVSDIVDDMRSTVAEDLVLKYMPLKAYAEQWDIKGLKERVAEVFNLDLPIEDWVKEEGVANEEFEERILKAANELAARKVEGFGQERWQAIEKHFLLQTIDHRWREHLAQIDALRSVIHLRGYAQRDPLNEFKTEAFTLFETLLNDLRVDVCQTLSRIEPQPSPAEMQAARREAEANAEMARREAALRSSAAFTDPGAGPGMLGAARPPAPGAAGGAPAQAPAAAAMAGQTAQAAFANVGRNQPCPCGSGKKFKHCHGALAEKAQA